MANETEPPALKSSPPEQAASAVAMSATIPPEPSEATPAASPWIGRIIDGRYRVVELLAEGGMGTVFIAEHLKLRKRRCPSSSSPRTWTSSRTCCD